MEPIQEQPTESEDVALSIFGIYFCQRCRNMMIPYLASSTILEFKCQSCGIREVDFRDRRGEDCLLFGKESKTVNKKFTPDYDYIFDPSMPTVEISCPECGFNKAIYFLIPDQNETKMIARMMCKSLTGSTVKCGHIWDLNDQSELSQAKVKIKQLEEDSYELNIS